uniref:RRM domain-containing protein n=1 Tax=Panagrolaimus superbus TaxID=310955 RepID=A0A914YEB3_9BILA
MASQQTILELSELDGDWETWIKNVIDTKDFVVTTKSFEELLSILPEDVNIWREYLDYLKNFQKIEILDVYSRCCHMFMEETYFWQDYLFQLERFGQEWKKLYEVFEEALGYTETAESASALYRTIIYAKLRYIKIDSIGKDTIDFSPVGELFENAYKFLNLTYGQYWDENRNFTKNYAYFAFYRLNNVELGRKLWKEILGSGIANKSKWWIEAANMERRFGSVDGARTILYRAINSVFDNYEPLFDYFIQFERDEGNFEQVQKALKKVNDQMGKILQAQEVQQKNEAKEKAKKNFFKGGKQEPLEKGIQKKQQPEPFRKPDTPRVPARKRPATSRLNGEEPLTKIQGNVEPLEVMKDKDGFVIPQMPIRLSPRSGGSSPINSDSSKAAIIEKPKEISMEVDNNVDPKKTVFISNLDFAVSEQEISSFFPGNIEVRLVKRPGTNISKGYGYVDFNTVEAAQSALKLDRTLYKGRPVFVSENNPHEKGEHAEFKYSTNIERNKLFVKNLPFKCNNDQLKEEFSVYGKVNDARIVTKKSGMSKCCGYVEFETEADAGKALSAQIEIDGRPISVWISNPPAKTDSKPGPQQQQQGQRNQQKSALGSRSKPMATPTNAGRKMRIESFVPRSVAISKPKPVK